MLNLEITIFGTIELCSNRALSIVKRMCKQWWSTIPQISTKQTTNTNTIHDIYRWKSRALFETDTKRGSVKPVNGIQNFLIIVSPIVIDIIKQTKPTQFRLNSKRPQNVTQKMYNSIHMNSTKAESGKARSQLIMLANKVDFDGNNHILYF